MLPPTPPTLRAEFLAADVPIRRLLTRHGERVHAHRMEHRGCSAVRVSSFVDLLASAERVEESKRVHLAALGGISREAFVHMMAEGQEGAAHAAYSQVEALRKRKDR